MTNQHTDTPTQGWITKVEFYPGRYAYRSGWRGAVDKFIALVTRRLQRVELVPVSDDELMQLTRESRLDELHVLRTEKTTYKGEMP